MGKLLTYVKRKSGETFSSLMVRNYRLYYIGQIISTSGTFMQTVSQGWLVLKLTNSGTALGVVVALQYLPILVLGPYGGVIADRYPKRKILYFTQSIAGLLALILGILVATNIVRLWMVFVLAFLLGLNSVFDNPTRQTFHIELVGPDKLRNAVTLYSTLVNLSRVIGPAVAAGLIATIGIAACFILNGISYFAVVIMLALMHTDEMHLSPPVPPFKGQLKEGFKYLLSTPIIGFPLLMMALMGTFTYEFQVSLPLIAQNVFKSDASGYAFLTSAMGVGAVVGGLFFAGRKRGAPFKLVTAALLLGFAILTAAFMPSLLFAGVAMVIVGFCSINFSSLGNTTLQLECSPEMRGRVMSFWAIAFLGMTTIGGPIVGRFAEVAGARWALALGGIAALVAAGIGAVTLRNLQTVKVNTKEPVEM
ncbi:MAG: MFS transporter [Pelolinea sp.]|nr:MFS transporter [Pelolinea sp.]